MSAIQGKNTLEIAGSGKKNTYGMTISNVRLVKASADPVSTNQVSTEKNSKNSAVTKNENNNK